jgi:hypothetical protein
VVRIPDLLRAAAVLDRATPTTIAIRTGIRRSRVGRLLTGRTHPRGDEPARILASCGTDPSLVTTPRLTGAGALPARTVFGLLLNRDQHAHRDLDTNSCRLSVDYLSISFNAPTEELLSIARAAGRVHSTKRPAYRHEYRCGAILVQHGKQGQHGRSAFKHRRRDSRLAFNPSHASAEDWIVVRRVLAVAADVRITRVDVAVDVRVSIARLQVLAEPGRKLNIFIGPGGVESFYVGARKSERQVRVYDKRRELIDKGRANESYPQTTRIEAQLRNLGPLSDLRELRDPFARLALVDLSAGGLPFLHALGASYAATFGAPSLRGLVPRSEYDAIVRQVSTSEAAHPSRVFAAHWPRVVRRLLRQLARARC